MRYVAFYRALKFALQNFRRNIWLSLVTTIILFLTLFSIAFSASINFLTNQATKLVRDQVDVSVYFKESALEEDVRSVQSALTELPEVKEVTYISKEEALALFKQRTAGNAVIQETLGVLDTNPLGATLVVKAHKIEDFDAIIKVLEKDEFSQFIEDRNFEENQTVITRLTDLSNRVREVGIVVSVVFALVAILVIFNTIRITIYTHRDEINIMKLVGASNWFIRAPLVIESVLYAIIASLLAIFALMLLVGLSAPFLNAFFVGYNFNLVHSFQSYLWVVFGIQLLIGIVLAVLSTLFAIGRHLRV